MADNLPPGFTLQHDNPGDAAAPLPIDPQSANGLPSGFQLEDDKYSTPGQQLLTVAEGGLEGFLGPVKTAVEAGLTKLGLSGFTPEDQEARTQTNPGEHYGSQIVGFGAGALTGTGEAALLAKIGEGAVGALNLGKAATLGAKLASSGIRAGAEMAALQTGDEISKAINQDPNQTLGSAAINVGLSGLIGGAGGVALGGVSNLWKTATNKIGVSKVANDFMGESKFLQENPDVAGGAVGEVNQRMAEADQILNGGLKGKAIAQTLPEATPENMVKIDQHLQDISSNAEKRIQEASKNAYLKGAVPKLTQDLEDFQSVITDPQASVMDKWDALDDFKRASQGHANYNIITGGAEEKALSKWIKPFNAELREAAENSKVWGAAGDVQASVNKAAAELYEAQKDFLSKVTGKELGERIADPNKVQTLLNQLEKGKGGLRANAVANYLDATQKASDAIHKAYIENGLEAPMEAQLNPTPILDRSLNTPITPGRSLAQWANRKGAQTLSRAVGESASGVVGGGLGALVGHPLAGAYLGEKILSPVMSALAKPFAENAINSEAMKTSVDYLANSARGMTTMDNTVKNFFRSAEIIPKDMMPDKQSREKLDKSLASLDSPQNMMQVGGNIGHYLPDHATAAASMAATAKNYFDSLKPKQTPLGPFDDPPPKDKAAQYKYYRALDVAQQPLLVLKYAKQGVLLPQDVQTLNALYPGLQKSIADKLSQGLINHQAEGKKLPYHQRVSLSMLMGSNLDSTMNPQSMQAIMHTAGMQGMQQQVQQMVNSKPGKVSGTAMTQINKVNQLYATNSQLRQMNRK